MFSYKVEQISVKTSDQAPKQHMFILPVISWPFVSISSSWSSISDCNKQQEIYIISPSHKDHEYH